jgi:beta-glucosidase
VLTRRTSLHIAMMMILTAFGGSRLATQVSPPILESGAFQAQYGTHAPPPVDTGRIRSLVAAMTLREKVGQMTQLELGMITDGSGAGIRINPDKLHKAIVEYGVGSILNVKDQALSVDTWRGIIAAIQTAAAGTRLKTPVIYGIDSIHGANYVRGAVLFPQPLGMAATWNPELMLDASRITAAETRAAGIPWNFSPVLDIGRQPLWPRLYETFGEDVYLDEVMAAAVVRGYQGDDASADDRVAACLKHYVGYSAPTSGHDRAPALIPEVTLREHFLPPFAAGVRAGALSVMVNSGEVNGIPGHVNGRLLKDVLRGELGFDGVVVSDWEDIKKLVTIHRVAASEKDATRDAILAGIDMSMVPQDYSFSDVLLQLAEEGTVPVSRIDEAVARILTLKVRLGLFDDALRGVRARTRVGSDESRATALEAARESIVLLKNADGVLPLPPSARVVVTGPTADSLPSLNNGWTFTWQGSEKDLYPADRATVRAALEAKFPGRTTYVRGTDYDKEIDVAAAVSAASKADAAIVCLGEPSYAETPGNIDDLALPAAQLHLASAIAATGRPTIVVLIEGRPRLLRGADEQAKGVVLALNPGLEGGRAIADVLTGEVNPSGRLPITYPRDPNALLTYDHKPFEEQDTSFGFKAFHPLFEFGFGLSYTDFAYSQLDVTPKDGPLTAPTTVSVSVRNGGRRAGADVVQLFVSQQVASVTPPVKRLKRFARVVVAPGEARSVRFQLTGDDFTFIGQNGRRVAEPGVYTVMVGPLRQELRRN